MSVLDEGSCWPVSCILREPPSEMEMSETAAVYAQHSVLPYIICCLPHFTVLTHLRFLLEVSYRKDGKFEDFPSKEVLQEKKLSSQYSSPVMFPLRRKQRFYKKRFSKFNIQKFSIEKSWL